MENPLCKPLFPTLGRPLRHRRKRRRHLPLQGRPWASHRRGGLWPPPKTAFLEKRADEQCSSLRLLRPAVGAAFGRLHLVSFGQATIGRPYDCCGVPSPLYGRPLRPPVVLPPAGEAPAKRVMRENDGPQSAVEISEVDSALPHLSAALTFSPAGGGTTPSVTAAGGGDTSPFRGGHGGSPRRRGGYQPPACFPCARGGQCVPRRARSPDRAACVSTVVGPTIGRPPSTIAVPENGRTSNARPCACSVPP